MKRVKQGRQRAPFHAGIVELMRAVQPGRVGAHGNAASYAKTISTIACPKDREEVRMALKAMWARLKKARNEAASAIKGADVIGFTRLQTSEYKHALDSLKTQDAEEAARLELHSRSGVVHREPNASSAHSEGGGSPDMTFGLAQTDAREPAQAGH